jgi:hypothetical protein
MGRMKDNVTKAITCGETVNEYISHFFIARAGFCILLHQHKQISRSGIQLKKFTLFMRCRYGPISVKAYPFTNELHDLA